VTGKPGLSVAYSIWHCLYPFRSQCVR